jgi:thiamine-phosphate pyrophosphorylase
VTQHTHDLTAPADPGLRRSRTEKLAAARLYLCTDARLEQDDLEEFLHAAYSGGADIVQLRDKALDTDAEIEALQVLARVAAQHEKLFAVNDRADVAALVGADVFHTGQHDLSPAQARSLLGPDVLIGRSTHDLGQARTALEDPDVDYFCTGPVWETPTKPGRTATGLRFLREVADLSAGAPAAVTKPWFAIGGIDGTRLPAVLGAGATRAVVVRALTTSADPHDTADRLRRGLDAPGGQ